MKVKRGRWYEWHSRESVCVEYYKYLGCGFSIDVAATGFPQHPFPASPEEIEFWVAYIWKPGASSSRGGRRFKTAEAAMHDGERRARDILYTAVRQLTAIIRDL
jgi:hypothetical protein